MEFSRTAGRHIAAGEALGRATLNLAPHTRPAVACAAKEVVPMVKKVRVTHDWYVVCTNGEVSCPSMLLD